MTKNVLFLVTGMTPQIITETVWALACDPSKPDQWIPDEIHVLSTEHGLTQIRASLFADGRFEQLLTDYHLPSIRFDESFLHCIYDFQGEALSDLKTPQDNELAANMICDIIRELTSDPEINLHVSIAGGRKTMGFYAGYALSLYGRANDKMSHVLVSGEFEASREFFYPAPQPKTVFVSQFGKNERLDAYDAKVWLANIPFVRLRNSLPESSVIKTAAFSEVVNSINLANQPFKVILNIKKQTVNIAEDECNLSSREFAFYLWFAKNALEQQTSILAPERGIVPSSAKKQDYPYMFEVAQAYLKHYIPLKGNLGNDSVQETLKFGMERTFFDDRLTAIRKAFKKKFGDDLAKKIEVKNLSREPENKMLGKAEKNALVGHYQLLLGAGQIEIIAG